jgi:hypothetical protein
MDGLSVSQAIEQMELEEAMYRPLASAVTAQQMGAMPTASAQQVELGGITARTGPIGGPMETARTGAQPRTVRRGGPTSADADLYDRRIEGGYGKSRGSQESGEAAVRRIQEEQRKRRIRRSR